MVGEDLRTTLLVLEQLDFLENLTCIAVLPLCAYTGNLLMWLQAFKPHLEAFLPLLFAGLASGHQLSEAAAGNCLGRLRDWLGPNIFASRLSPDQQSLMLNRLVPPPAPRGVMSA